MHKFSYIYLFLCCQAKHPRLKKLKTKISYFWGFLYKNLNLKMDLQMKSKVIIDFNFCQKWLGNTSLEYPQQGFPIPKIWLYLTF